MKPTVSKADARLHPRVVIDVSVRIFANSTTPTLGRAHDISRGGMSLYAALELADGEVIRIAFELPHSRIAFELNASVINRNGFRYGIEFLKLTAKESAELGRVIDLLALTQH